MLQEYDQIMAQRIHNKRIEKGWTMAELGDKVGVQSSAVNKWEKGIVSNIKSSTIAKLAQVFGVSPVWLMGFSDAEVQKPTTNFDMLYFDEEIGQMIIELKKSKQDSDTLDHFIRTMYAMKNIPDQK